MLEIESFSPSLLCLRLVFQSNSPGSENFTGLRSASVYPAVNGYLILFTLDQGKFIKAAEGDGLALPLICRALKMVNS